MLELLKLLLYGIVTLGLLGNCDPRGSLGEINLALAAIVLKLSIFILSLPNSKHWRLGVSFAFLQRLELELMPHRVGRVLPEAYGGASGCRIGEVWSF